MKKTTLYILIALMAFMLAGCSTTQTESRLPIITIVNNTGFDCYRLFVSPITDGDWGDDVLGREILLNGDAFRVRLTIPLSIVDSYDIMIIDIDDDIYVKKGVKLSNGANIVFTQHDIDEQ